MMRFLRLSKMGGEGKDKAEVGTLKNSLEAWVQFSMFVETRSAMCQRRGRSRLSKMQRRAVGPTVQRGVGGRRWV